MPHTLRHSLQTQEVFVQHERIIEDRGSRYSVSYGRISSPTDTAQFLAQLKKSKKYSRATHNTYAVRYFQSGLLQETKSDDGEKGAGMIVLNTLRAHDAINCIVCVTRWFGGTKLMHDRFKHVETATKLALSDFQSYPPGVAQHGTRVL